MYIYNVTINIDSDIQQEWLHWMQTEHIPEMLATGSFRRPKWCVYWPKKWAGLRMPYNIPPTVKQRSTGIIKKMPIYFGPKARNLKENL